MTFYISETEARANEPVNKHLHLDGIDNKIAFQFFVRKEG
jgi:hypothetical protein